MGRPKKKLTELNVVRHFETRDGPQPGTMLLMLRFLSVADVQAQRWDQAQDTTLILLDEQARDLAEMLSGKTAATPRPDKYDS